ncbi:MAG: hypothetical protein RL354_2568 [Planctomycetota bacterium]
MCSFENSTPSSASTPEAISVRHSGMMARGDGIGIPSARNAGVMALARGKIIGPKMSSAVKALWAIVSASASASSRTIAFQRCDWYASTQMSCVKRGSAVKASLNEPPRARVSIAARSGMRPNSASAAFQSPQWVASARVRARVGPESLRAGVPIASRSAPSKSPSMSARPTQPCP